MYLNKHIFVGAPYEYRKVTGTIKLKTNGEQIKINTKKVLTIVERSMYWRKANHIHNWFVKNVKDGIDDCKEYYVTMEQLKDLLEVCQKVMDDRSQAALLLPTQEGFFFGSTDYDEDYFADIEYTIRMLSTVTSEDVSKQVDYYYSSSW